MSNAQKAKENLQKAQVKENTSFDIIRQREMQQQKLLEAIGRDNDPWRDFRPFNSTKWGSHVIDQQVENRTGVPQRPLWGWFSDPVGMFSQYAFMWLVYAVVGAMIVFGVLFDL